MTTSLPLVSVCIPCYNCVTYLPAALESVYAQAYQNIEIIIVDDGSSDDTKAFLDTIRKERVKIYNQKNKGAAAARNLAFEKSSGTFIKFLDADDLLSPESINAQVKLISGKPGYLASGRWGRFCKNDLSDLKIITEKVWQDYEGITWLIDSLIVSGTNMMQPGIFLIPRELIMQSGTWNEDLSLIDDFEFMTRVMINCKGVIFSSEALLKYRGGQVNSLSGQRSETHMISAFKAVQICTELILEKQNDKYSRLACANVWQRWAFQFYPEYKDLTREAEIFIQKLGGSTINIGGGDAFVRTSKIIGWKNAVALKQWVRKN